MNVELKQLFWKVMFIGVYPWLPQVRTDTDGRRSEQVGEVLDRKSGVADEGSQRSLGKLPLAVELVADPAKGVDGLRA
jgi:hypothetical protein